MKMINLTYCTYDKLIQYREFYIKKIDETFDEDKARKFVKRLRDVERAIKRKRGYVQRVGSGLKLYYAETDWRYVYRIENDDVMIYFERENMEDIVQFSKNFDYTFKLFEKSMLDGSMKFVCYIRNGQLIEDTELKVYYKVRDNDIERIFLSKSDIDDWVKVNNVKSDSLEIIEVR